MSPDVESLADGALASRIAAAGTRLDAAAEAELCRRLAPRVRLYGLRHLRDPHAAHDLMQQVLLMTLERLRDGRLREPERIVSFVLGICRMVVLEIQRGSWRREKLLATYGDTGEAVEDSAVASRSQALETSSESAWYEPSAFHPITRVT